MISLPESNSENRALELLTPTDLAVYSAGISTGGLGEVAMVRAEPKRSVIATTVDVAGADFTRSYVEQCGFARQIDVRIEDLAEPLPHDDETFDFVYSRLALHYLRPTDLDNALAELHRVLRAGHQMFCLVRSVEGLGLQPDSVQYDPNTNTTSGVDDSGNPITHDRYLQTNTSIAEHVTRAGFTIEKCSDYDEGLYADYERTIGPVDRHVVEVVASRRQS